MYIFAPRFTSTFIKDAFACMSRRKQGVAEIEILCNGDFLENKIPQNK